MSKKSRTQDGQLDAYKTGGISPPSPTLPSSTDPHARPAGLTPDTIKTIVHSLPIGGRAEGAKDATAKGSKQQPRQPRPKLGDALASRECVSCGYPLVPKNQPDQKLQVCSPCYEKIRSCNVEDVGRYLASLAKRPLPEKELQYDYGVTARLRKGGSPSPPLPPSKTFTHATLFSQLESADHGPDDDGFSEQQAEWCLERTPPDYFAAIDPRERYAQAVKESKAVAVLTPVEVGNMAPIGESDGESVSRQKLADKTPAEIEEAFQKALVGLSCVGRRAVWLYVMNRKTANEIARQLHKSRSQITRYLRRGMALLGLNPNNGRVSNLFDFSRLTRKDAKSTV